MLARVPLSGGVISYLVSEAYDARETGYPAPLPRAMLPPP